MKGRDRPKPGARSRSGGRVRVSESAQEGERIQKVLAQAGLASRREAEEWIRAGRVTVNGAVAELGSRVIGRDELRVDGRVARRSRDASRLSKETTKLCTFPSSTSPNFVKSSTITTLVGSDFNESKY